VDREFNALIAIDVGDDAIEFSGLHIVVRQIADQRKAEGLAMSCLREEGRQAAKTIEAHKMAIRRRIRIARTNRMLFF
jgi:hypothetical protein